MDDRDEHIQRALNEAKREELREKYGAEFRNGDRALPPEIESRWLHEIEEFERRFDQANQVSVRKYVGDPPCRPLGEIPQADLPGETEHLLDLLRSNSIEICFGRDLSDSEMYRFITEEIFAQEIADLRIDGLTLSFLYEEFHPDPVREAGWAAEDFLRAIFERNEPAAGAMISSAACPGGTDGTPAGDDLRSAVLAFLAGTAAFLTWKTDIIACTVEGDEASVRAGVCWSGLEADTLRTVSASGDAIIHLRMRTGVWEISAARLPGLSLR